MDQREELVALRRLAELEAKAGSTRAKIDADPISQGAKNFADDLPFAEKLVAGYGSAVPRLVRGIGQRLGINSQAEVDEANKLDAPLLNTGGGMVGNVLGNVAAAVPTVAIPGAASIPGAAIIGAAQGAAIPTSTGESVERNILLGGAAGGLSAAAGKGIGAVLDRRAASVTATQAGNAQKFAAARQGSAAGYVVPPADLEPGITSSLMSGLSGKIKTAQEASVRNQTVTDRLAREALGLQAGDELTGDVLQGIRNTAGRAGYAPLRAVGEITPDQQYFAALDNLASTSQGAARSFPGLADSGITDLVAKMKQPKFDAGDAIDATIVLRDMADKAYRGGDKAVGKATKAIATELENTIERQLTAAGDDAAVKAFREARTQIAKTYTVQKGLNSQTGNVSAQSLAGDLAKGRPLSNELLTIAEMGRAFPKATQALREAPGAVSPLDVGLAAGLGDWRSIATLGGRPLARNALLSGPVQRQALQQSAPMSPQDNLLLQLLRNNVAPQSALSQR